MTTLDSRFDGIMTWPIVTSRSVCQMLFKDIRSGGVGTGGGCRACGFLSINNNHVEFFLHIIAMSSKQYQLPSL